MKTVAVIGAGPAGLSAAYKLLSSSNEFEVIDGPMDIRTRFSVVLQEDLIR